jgi:isopentenyl phosphate kinase
MILELSIVATIMRCYPVTIACINPAYELRSFARVREVLEHDLVPEWLHKSWEGAKESGFDRLSGDEIAAEIPVARKARRGPHLQPGS